MLGNNLLEPRTPSSSLSSQVFHSGTIPQSLSFKKIALRVLNSGTEGLARL